ncbi:hypothetical protein JEZ23_22720 [Pseudomonas aeruginosa]|uniref:hypothetical protein n=1 Tax=Pseudomonas aeruginosa TaxID=287 RepID=UPI0011451EEE|nr:hypothetical protein [Pseudomonas aeruginosa]MBG4707847.1 hypothetical protein [Pseudomonas aeruginosa]MBI8516369.1 hypothetical protein [Pseudomonas aeruginosa]MBI8533899.1 hypothetical protein [Pseudomonas aeruginosa]MCO3336214.1 hypothetical protein [Pseudomonas aeruginosa]NRS77064.1 hypothetical protein [Pseudomonas aeruginosa]
MTNSTSTSTEQPLQSVQQRPILPEEVGRFATDKPPQHVGGRGVNAKSSRRRPPRKILSTPQQAGLVASFHAGHEQRVAAISELHPDLDNEQLTKLRSINSFISQLARSYKGKGTGKLADWSKHVPAHIKQFFRLLWLARQPDAKAFTIRLDHDTATAALAAKRSPANHLAGIIQRTLTKLGITTEQASNLEFVHGTSRENHPLHVHGIFCIPADRSEEVSKALRIALAKEYRQRFGNLAVHIESIQNERWWAAYCIKEDDITAGQLGAIRNRETDPDYASHAARRGGKLIYERVSDWLD